MDVTKKTYELGFLGFVENLGGWGFCVRFSPGGVIEAGIFMWKFCFSFVSSCCLNWFYLFQVLHQ